MHTLVCFDLTCPFLAHNSASEYSCIQCLNILLFAFVNYVSCYLISSMTLDMIVTEISFLVFQFQEYSNFKICFIIP